MIEGMEFFSRTSSEDVFNLASYHSPHSITWRWIISFSRRDIKTKRPWFFKYKSNTGITAGFKIPFLGDIYLKTQKSDWYKDAYNRLVEGKTYIKPSDGWVCFHCGERFTTIGSARDHFGAEPDAKPGCMLKIENGDEKGLLMTLRETESRVIELLEIIANQETEFYSARSDNIRKINKAEEEGYQKKIKDVSKEFGEVATEILFKRCRVIGRIAKSKTPKEYMSIEKQDLIKAIEEISIELRKRML